MLKRALLSGCTAALASLLAVHPAFSQAAANSLSVDLKSNVAPVSPMFYGLMTEEINHSYEGGLYAEMVGNRTFRADWAGAEHWLVLQQGQAKASIAPDSTNGPSSALTHSLKVTVQKASPDSAAGVINTGWWGMTVRPQTAYKGSLWAKTDGGSPRQLSAALVNDDSGAVVAQAAVTLKPGAWSEYTYTLTTGRVPSVTAHNHLRLSVTEPGTLWLQAVSLMPPTYANRANGNRIDLMEKMAAMHPHFIRLPGGNYLEGNKLADWYNWKKTIGPQIDRPGHPSPWNYWSTDGFGFLEYLEWCEDLHAEPVLAVYAGYALEHDYIKPGADLEPFVQSALDEVEYVTGDTSTRWGAERAKDGHPAPFPLHFIEIGNEDDFDKSGSYPGRFTQFALALRKKYPQYKLIATTPITVSADATPDMIDDHYYKSPGDMFELVHHYDDAPRTGPKVFVGEWATRSFTPTPNFGDALGDAAWMTAMERNSDLIQMASYAPLLTNVNPGAMQWSTDLIGYDALSSYGSPSWYAQCLFSEHMGDTLVKTTLKAGERLFSSATLSARGHMLHLKLVNASDQAQPLAIDLGGAAAGEAKVWSLHANNYSATNTLSQPDAIHPIQSTLASSSLGSHTVPPLTIEVIDIPVR